MNQYTVLLVDDEEEVFQVIMKKLNWESMGFSIAGYARNGVEALEMAEELQPDVVMTDIKMPYMDGLTLCKKLKELYQKVKVIIFSGFDEFEYAKEAIKIEAEEYILKPINSNELRDEKLMNVELRCMEEPDFLDLRYKAERFMNADGYGFGGILDKTANLISHIIVLCGIVGVIVSLSPIIILVFVSMIGLNAWIDAKVKKMNIKLDLERPKYERKLAYEESICGEYRFAKEVRIYGLKHWVLEQIGIQIGRASCRERV